MSQDNFIEQNIISLLGLHRLPLAERTMILNDLVMLVQRRIMVRVVNDLDNTMLDELNHLLEVGDNVGVGEFFEKNISGFHALVAEEALRLKEEMRDLVAETVGADVASSSVT